MVVILLIDPHSGDEHARAPGAIIIGFLVLCVTIIITRPKPVQEFIREKEAIIASLLSFGLFGVVAFASQSLLVGILAAFLFLYSLMPRLLKILWKFTLNRIRELSRAIQGKE